MLALKRAIPNAKHAAQVQNENALIANIQCNFINIFSHLSQYIPFEIHYQYLKKKHFSIDTCRRSFSLQHKNNTPGVIENCPNN